MLDTAQYAVSQLPRTNTLPREAARLPLTVQMPGRYLRLLICRGILCAQARSLFLANDGLGANVRETPPMIHDARLLGGAAVRCRKGDMETSAHFVAACRPTLRFHFTFAYGENPCFSHFL